MEDQFIRINIFENYFKKFNLNNKEIEIAKNNIKSNDEHLILRVFQRMEQGLSFKESLKIQINTEEKISEELKISRYWDQYYNQLNEFYKHS